MAGDPGALAAVTQLSERIMLRGIAPPIEADADVGARAGGHDPLTTDCVTTTEEWRL